MNYRKEIEQFVPGCEQEEADRDLILELCDQYGDDILNRTTRVAHMTASSMIFNKERTKVLMAYHNIYDSWAWTGGHSDGEPDALVTALKEAEEETGISNLKMLKQGAAAIDILEVKNHVKRGKFVSPHLHLNLAYVFEADENADIHICESENSNVGWIRIDELEEKVSEKHMLPVYRKIVERVTGYEKSNVDIFRYNVPDSNAYYGNKYCNI